jgi:hypothetical protein
LCLAFQTPPASCLVELFRVQGFVRDCGFIEQVLLFLVCLSTAFNSKSDFAQKILRYALEDFALECMDSTLYSEYGPPNASRLVTGLYPLP